MMVGLHYGGFKNDRYLLRPHHISLKGIGGVKNAKNTS